jgi:hypothetical protein
MVHSGYEASAVNDTFGSAKGFFRTVRATLFNKYKNKAAATELATARPAKQGLVQLNVAPKASAPAREVERV